jgi:hypothetical protein
MLPGSLFKDTNKMSANFKHQVTQQCDFVIVKEDRSYGGAPELIALKVDGNTGKASILAVTGAGPAAAVAVGNAAQLGTGPTASAVGSSLAVEVTLTTGSGTSALVGSTPITAFTLTVPAGIYSVAPFCSAEPSNAVAAQLEAGGITGGTQAAILYYDRAASTSTSLVFKLVSNGTPTLTASTAYKFEVWING